MKKTLGRWPVYLLIWAFSLYLPAGSAQTPSLVAKTAQSAGERDGRHDFDFELGTWKIHLKRLVQPLTGSSTWVHWISDQTRVNDVADRAQ